MRITADTNTVISALLWKGNPRKIFDAARDGIVELHTTAELVAELEGVLSRERFKKHLETANVSVRELVDGYATKRCAGRDKAFRKGSRSPSVSGWSEAVHKGNSHDWLSGLFSDSTEYNPNSEKPCIDP